MNKLFSKTIIILVLIFFNQFSVGMEQLYLVPTQLSDLSPEVQEMFFKHSDNFSNIQRTNTHWAQRKSIKSPHVFITDGCSFSDDRMMRILLNAIHQRNYEGVKNILTYRLKGCLPYYHVDITPDGRKTVLDLHTIAEHNDDEEMSALLNLYNIKVMPLDEQIVQHYSIELMMASLTGGSEAIGNYLNDVYTDIENSWKMRDVVGALKIVIDCNYGKCVQVFLNNLYYDSNVGDISLIEMISPAVKEALLRIDFLYHACREKKINALKELLDIRYFNLNKKENEGTLLDEMVKKAKEDSEYNAIVRLLQQYGAKTAEALDIENQDDNEALGKLAIPCIIF